MPGATSATLPVDPLWYKDAVIYELHVKTFQRQQRRRHRRFPRADREARLPPGTGVTAIWLLPFYPSPLRDDGYDIADYYDVNPNYGTLAGFSGVPRGGA